MAIVLALLAAVVPAAPAGAAGDPILPLGLVRSGAQCTGYSVVRGTEPTPFAVEVLDVVAGDPGSDGPRILVRVSGPAVDQTGVGPGFSGSPIYCPGPDGAPANAGAISESIGEYGGKVVLATPIEAILGNPVVAPAATRARPSLLRRARPLAAPLSVSGLSRPVALALTRAGRRAGRPVIATPSGPLGSFAPQRPRPGSAMSVGLSSGDVAVGGVGTVAYVDGDRVWSYGHDFENGGRRALLLQDAYVYRVIGNPNVGGEAGSTYKLAAAGHDLGTLSNDALTGVVGRLGALPPTIPVQVVARDEDTGRIATTRATVADETDAGNPGGASALALVAPLAVSQAAAGILRSSPVRATGSMCLRISVRELPRRPLRFCNRYVTSSTTPGAGENGNVLAARAGGDASEAIALLDGFPGPGLHVTDVTASLRVRRGARQAFMRSVALPRRARPGARVRVRLAVQQLRGPRETVAFTVRLPNSLRPGLRRLQFSGTGPDTGDDDLEGALTITLGGEDDEQQAADGDVSPRTLRALGTAFRALGRDDGVRVKLPGRPRRSVYRDDGLRIAGKATGVLRVTRGR